MKQDSSALLYRVAEYDRQPCEFILDGKSCTAMMGDTLLTAVLTQQAWLRHSDFSGTPRAGFCLMGACQDCWIWMHDGRRVQACSTLIRPGMVLQTTSPANV